MIRRYEKHSDNAPAYGYAIVEDIQGTGEFKLPINWSRAPQDAIITFGQAFNLPPEYIPTEGSTLLRLDQAAPSGVNYDLYTHDDTAGGTATTASALHYVHVIDDSQDTMVSPQAWYLETTGTGAADRITFSVQEFVDRTDMYAIIHEDSRITGELHYFGTGSDISTSHGLATGTRWSLPTSLTDDDNIAEMIFVNGEQIVGDIYSHYYSGYGGGAYDMHQMEDGTVEIEFVDPVDITSQTLMMAIFIRIPQPEINVRYNNPFDDDGVWVEYHNIPKGDLKLSYYIS